MNEDKPPSVCTLSVPLTSPAPSAPPLSHSQSRRGGAKGQLILTEQFRITVCPSTTVEGTLNAGGSGTPAGETQEA